MLALFSNFFLLSFRADFVYRFLIVLGCQHGAFLEPKINQNATYEFLMFIDFTLVLPLLLRLGGSYVGSISVLFAHRFLHRFLVDLGIDFGALLGAFGGVQIDHFWHQFWDDFCMSFQERPKSAQERPKSAQERPKSAQEGPKRGQERPKRGPRAAKRGPRAAPKHPMSGKESEICVFYL